MTIKVKTRKQAWDIADRLFPTDYERNADSSGRAGYPIYETTSTDEDHTGFHISDLNTSLELNMGVETIKINIESEEADENKETRNCFNKLLEKVKDERRLAEVKERQKYNYYSDRTNYNWNWSEKDDKAYQKEWDELILKLRVLKELENAMETAKKKEIF